MTLLQAAHIDRARRRPRPILTESSYVSTQQRGRYFSNDYFTTRFGGVAR